MGGPKKTLVLNSLMGAAQPEAGGGGGGWSSEEICNPSVGTVSAGGLGGVPPVQERRCHYVFCVVEGLQCLGCVSWVVVWDAWAFCFCGCVVFLRGGGVD